MQVPVVTLREWSCVHPDDPRQGFYLRGVRLTDVDRQRVAQLEQATSVRIAELRSGLSISVGPHIGTIQLSSLRIVIKPKMHMQKLMRIMNYAFDAADMATDDVFIGYESHEQQLVDLVAVSLLHAVKRIFRAGLYAQFVEKTAQLAAPRGRLDLRHYATHRYLTTVRCRFDDLTVDSVLNQVIAAGLRMASTVVQSPTLRVELARCADRFDREGRFFALNERIISSIEQTLDRKNHYYRSALSLISFIVNGTHPNTPIGSDTALSSFTVNMNAVFERFLGRYFSSYCPPNIKVANQPSRFDIYTYEQNDPGWNPPVIRPDFVFYQDNVPIVVADAKYKNHAEFAPSTQELYQLTTYGLAFATADRNEVLLLYPLVEEDIQKHASLVFCCNPTASKIRIRMVGVPMSRLLRVIDGELEPWWPFQVLTRTDPLVLLNR